MMTELQWHKRRLKMECRHSAALFKMLHTVNEGLEKMLRQKDEVESELQRNRAECEKLHSKLIKAGLE